MKKFLKIFTIFIAVVCVIVLAGLVYFNNTYPKVSPAKNISIKATPAMLERGKYLVNHVTVCIDCHSQRDWTKFSGPSKHGTEGVGGDIFDEKLGLPGTIVSKNITPVGISRYTDGELVRVLTQGVTKEGEVLFPLMPYHAYNKLTQDDLYSIIAYIRTLEPKGKMQPNSSVNFPVNLLIKTAVPEEYKPNKVNVENEYEYGKYLVTVAGCQDCHTPSEKGEPLKGKEFAGGMVVKDGKGYQVTTANLTPDKETGLGNWSKEFFVNFFKNFRDSKHYVKAVNTGEFNTIMPWSYYSGMTDKDLGAIYTYLHSLKPVKNKIVKWQSEASQYAAGVSKK